MFLVFMGEMWNRDWNYMMCVCVCHWPRKNQLLSFLWLVSYEYNIVYTFTTPNLKIKHILLYVAFLCSQSGIWNWTHSIYIFFLRECQKLNLVQKWHGANANNFVLQLMWVAQTDWSCIAVKFHTLNLIEVHRAI